MYSAGREGRTAELDLDNAGVSTDDRVALKSTDSSAPVSTTSHR